jgi:hypothetical protein
MGGVDICKNRFSFYEVCVIVTLWTPSRRGRQNFLGAISKASPPFTTQVSAGGHLGPQTRQVSGPHLLPRPQIAVLKPAPAHPDGTTFVWLMHETILVSQTAAAAPSPLGCGRVGSYDRPPPPV